MSTATKPRKHPASEVIRARIPAEEKAALEAILADIGLDTSSLIRMLVRQTIRHHGIPFPVVVQEQPPKLTDERLDSIVDALNERFDQTMRDLAK